MIHDAIGVLQSNQSIIVHCRASAFRQAEEDEVEENMRDEIPYEMETDFGVNDLPYLRVPIFRVSTLLASFLRFRSPKLGVSSYLKKFKVVHGVAANAFNASHYPLDSSVALHAYDMFIAVHRLWRA